MIPISLQTDRKYTSLLFAARQLGFPLALWRLPHTQLVHLIVDVSGRAERTNIDLEELPTGFAFSPFLNPDGRQTHFIRAHVHCVKQDGHWRELPDESSSAFTDQKERLWQAASQFARQPSVLPASNNLSTAESLAEDWQHRQFTESVSRAVQAIKQGDLQKVVLSRTKTVQLPEYFDPLDCFHALAAAYPNAFVSMVAVPGAGLWMGASPELLISVNAAQVFRTMSLAGTQRCTPGFSINQAAWTQKEINEQALVSRYIVNCFKKIRLREYEEEGPRTVVAGNLMHLRTDFSVDMQAVNFPQLGSVMLGLLHPTSAVCGMPKEAALSFISARETHGRAFYGGFLGPVNVVRETHLFVNLRCMQIGDGKATLYAGAGITADSDPQREWNETELKCQTLLAVLNEE